MGTCAHFYLSRLSRVTFWLRIAKSGTTTQTNSLTKIERHVMHNYIDFKHFVLGVLTCTAWNCNNIILENVLLILHNISWHVLKIMLLSVFSDLRCYDGMTTFMLRDELRKKILSPTKFYIYVYLYLLFFICSR